MLKTYLTAYPWDMENEGVEGVLDRLQGELGVTGVSLWVGIHPVHQLRTRDVNPRVFRTQGGLFFQPSEAHYSATRCKPIVSAWLKGRNPAARVAEACAKRGLALRGRVSAAETGRLPGRYPDMTCRNVFDAESSRSLCLADPDVQEYLCSVVSDLSESYGLEGVVLTDFGIAWSDAFSTDLQTPRRLSEAERMLLGVCFRECCQQKASAVEIDVHEAKQSTRQLLESLLSSMVVSERSFDAVVVEAPSLAAYLRWQTAELSALLNRLTQSCKCELIVERVAHGPLLVQHRELDWSPVAAVMLRPPADEPFVAAGVRANLRTELVIGHEQLVGRPAGDVVSRFSELAQKKLSAVEIDNFGLLFDETFTAVKQAIRFVRRSQVG